MGFNNILPFFFSFIGGITIPMVASNHNGPDLGIGMGFILGAIICLVTFFSAIVLIQIDKKARNHD